MYKLWLSIVWSILNKLCIKLLFIEWNGVETNSDCIIKSALIFDGLLLFGHDFVAVSWSLAWLVHFDFIFGVLVYSERDSFVFEIVNLVEMLKEGVANEVEVSTAALHLVLMDGELAPGSLSLMQILLWSHFEDSIGNLNTNWLQLWCDFFARNHYLAEVIVINAIQALSSKILFPLCSQSLEGLLWYTEVRATSIDDCWPFLFFCKVKFFTVVEHIPAFKCPLLDGVHPIWSVCHCWNFLETSNTTDNLILVQTTENSIRTFFRLWSSNTKTNNCLVDNFVVLQGPDIVKIPSIWFRMNCKTKDAINIIETFSLVKTEEINVNTCSHILVEAGTVIN